MRAGILTLGLLAERTSAGIRGTEWQTESNAVARGRRLQSTYCSVCYNLTEDQEYDLANNYDGAKQIVCDLTCEDGVTDPLHCNYFDLGQQCRGCGDCSTCQPCPATPSPTMEETPSPVEATASPTATVEIAPDIIPAPDTPSPTDAPTTPAPTTPTPIAMLVPDVIPETVEPTAATTPAPITPAPITPAPITPAPITPAPITPAPITPAPITPAPITPAPITPAPITPAPITPAPTTPAPMAMLAPDAVPETAEPTASSESDACDVCSNLSDAQLEALATYDNGGKRVVCDLTCLDGVSDPTHCNYFGLGQQCRGCGDCSVCTPCPEDEVDVTTTPSPTPTPANMVAPDATPDAVPTPQPVPTAADDAAYSSAPAAPPVIEPEPTTIAPLYPVPGADADVDVEDEDADADFDAACAACSELNEAQIEALAAYPDGGKQIFCDATCEGGDDVLHCNFFGLGQICRACGSCDECHPCP